MHELERRWRAFLDGFEARDDVRCLNALRAWIEEWDRCFWAADFRAFPSIYADGFRGRDQTVFPIGREVNGPAGFRELREEASDVLSRFWFDIQAFERGGDARFAGLGRMRARGRASGLLVQAPWAVVWTLERGKLAGATIYTSHRRARAEL